MEFSILFPFRNAAETMASSLESILDQYYGEFELVAIDDHSEDESRTIISGYQDKRIRLIDNPGKGLVDALNHGIVECRNPWIVRMDADDLMHPQRLAVMLSESRRSPGVQLVASSVSMFPEHSIQAGYREYIRWQNQVLSPSQIANQIYVESPFAHPSVMFLKSIINDIGGYRQGNFPEDYELWLRMFHAGCSMRKVKDVLLYWRDSADRLSRSHPSYRREAFNALRANYLARDNRIRNNRPLVFWGAGRKTRKRCALLIRQGFQPSAWIDIDEKKIGNVIWGARVNPPDWLTCQANKPFVLVYVTNHGAREEITNQLEIFGYTAGNDYLAVG